MMQGTLKIQNAWFCWIGWCWLACSNAQAADVPAAAVFPQLSNEETWAALPAAERGAGSELPSWARALAESLPRTTAAMLELDWQHRAGDHLDVKLRARLRWIVAQANRCDFAMVQARADLRRAGADDGELLEIQQGEPDRVLANLPATQVAALQFARQLTVDADSITDDQVRELVNHYGDQQLVAMVLLVAYGNFQDRLILALQLPNDATAELPPLDVRFRTDETALQAIAPERPPPSGIMPPPVPEKITDPEWLAMDFDTLQQNLTKQRERSGRIRVPAWEDIVADLPPAARNRPPLRIRWSLVCRGYQPELAIRWSACMRLFAEESQQDRIFEESVFWVITRTIHCFY